MITFRLLAVFLLICPILPAGQTSDDAARELIRKLPAGARATVSLTVRSSLSASEIARLRKTLEAELGVTLVEPGTEANIRITVSENLRQFLLIAEVGSGSARQVFIAEWPRRPASGSSPLPVLILDKKLLWEQETPILDVATQGERLLVLDPLQLSVYERLDGRWQLRGAAPISSEHAWPRDIRGRLLIQDDSFRAFLPGTGCRGTIAPEVKMDCSKANEPWPLGSSDGVGRSAALAPSGNFFEGRSVPPFFSMAVSGGRSENQWLFAGLDGRTLIYDDAGKPVGAITGWGSNIAGVETACGSGRQVLAVSSGDGTEPDFVQAYELVAGEAASVSPAAGFPGPVTALWPADGAAATVVALDNGSGRYAAYTLEIRCPR